jgi:acid phosphatase
MKWLAKFLWLALAALLCTSSCQPAQVESARAAASPTVAATAPAGSTSTPVPTATPLPLMPDFSHIVFIVFEGREYDAVINNRDMPYFNLLAGSYTLLTQYHAVADNSLPNYLALMGGDDFGITSDCVDSPCSIGATSLPDLIEASGRTWRTYQDDMPEPCFTEDAPRYFRRHNPFIFFDPIRADEERCKQRVVPLTYLEGDLAVNVLPNFIFISPDVCYSSQECTLDLVDGWLKEIITKIYPALDSTGEPFLIVLTWDKGQSGASCCGLPEPAGGRVATVLISPQVKQGFQDHTPYSHYSLLKTVSAAWSLPYLGHAADEETALITAPWK